jgi:hypothetical protein
VTATDTFERVVRVDSGTAHDPWRLSARGIVDDGLDKRTPFTSVEPEAGVEHVTR